MTDEERPVDPHVFSDPELYTPTPEELSARRKRSVAIALVLGAFMIFVFFTMLSRGGAI